MDEIEEKKPAVFDLGYMDLKDKIDNLAKALVEIDAVLVDVRYSARSRNAIWNKTALQELLGERYIHINELGNKNYAAQEGPIVYVDLEAGLGQVTKIMLMQKKSVVLMCGCWYRRGCHRMGIVQTFESKYGYVSTPLSAKMISELAHRNDPHQYELI